MIKQCPFCSAPVEIDIDWARKNGRIFCGGCCKAFDVTIQSEHPFPWRREMPPTTEEKKPEPPKEEIKPEKIEPDKYDSEDFGVFWDSMDYGSGL